MKCATINSICQRIVPHESLSIVIAVALSDVSQFVPMQFVILTATLQKHDNVVARPKFVQTCDTHEDAHGGRVGMDCPYTDDVKS